MTNIVIRRDHDVYYVQATGHATGSEKVCSGISSLLYAVAGWIINNEHMLRYHKISLKDGNAVIEWSGGPVAQAVYECVAIGLLQIEQSYPDFIKVDEIE